MISVRAESYDVHPASMLDGGFFLPLSINTLPDFGGVIIRGCYKMSSIGAETGVVHPVSILDGDFFLPLPVNKPPDFNGAITRGCCKVISVGTEAGFQTVSMRNCSYILAEKDFCFSQYFGNGKNNSSGKYLCIKS